MMAKTPERDVITSRKIGIVETTPDRQKESYGTCKNY